MVDYIKQLRKNNWNCVMIWPPSLLWGGGLFLSVRPEKVVNMEVKLCVRNLTMRAQSDADKAISIFNPSSVREFGKAKGTTRVKVS